MESGPDGVGVLTAKAESGLYHPGQRVGTHSLTGSRRGKGKPDSADRPRAAPGTLEHPGADRGAVRLGQGRPPACNAAPSAWRAPGPGGDLEHPRNGWARPVGGAGRSADRCGGAGSPGRSGPRLTPRGSARTSFLALRLDTPHRGCSPRTPATLRPCPPGPAGCRAGASVHSTHEAAGTRDRSPYRVSREQTPGATTGLHPPGAGHRGPAGSAYPPGSGVRVVPPSCLALLPPQSVRRRAWALWLPSPGSKTHPGKPQGLKAVVKPPGGGTGLPRLGVPGARLGASGWLLVVPEVVGIGKSWQE